MVSGILKPNLPCSTSTGGNGVVNLTIKQEGIDAILVEPGEHGIKNALSRGLSPVVNSTLQDAGFVKYSLPAVGIFDVLEHIENDVGYWV